MVSKGAKPPFELSKWAPFAPLVPPPMSGIVLTTADSSSKILSLNAFEASGSETNHLSITVINHKESNNNSQNHTCKPTTVTSEPLGLPHLATFGGTFMFVGNIF